MVDRKGVAVSEGHKVEELDSDDYGCEALNCWIRAEYRCTWWQKVFRYNRGMMVRRYCGKHARKFADRHGVKVPGDD